MQTQWKPPISFSLPIQENNSVQPIYWRRIYIYFILYWHSLKSLSRTSLYYLRFPPLCISSLSPFTSSSPSPLLSLSSSPSLSPFVSQQKKSFKEGKRTEHFAPHCLLSKLSPIHSTVASAETEIRLLQGKLQVQNENNLWSPWSQTNTQRLPSSIPTLFLVTIYL